ncbi:hypothetical protein AN219_37920 [Streptomyces nanshensis]|nr:hypothetical protein AN219_37920 [Streptomyces nanshensis]
MRIETETAEVLLFEKSTAALHQMHILAHEISHVVFDHPGTLALDDHAAVAAGLNSTLIRRMSARAGYTSKDEREAEMMATLIRQRVYRGRELPPSEPHTGSERWEALFAVPRQKRRSRP